jgi:hypothetical protein
MYFKKLKAICLLIERFTITQYYSQGVHKYFLKLKSNAPGPMHNLSIGTPDATDACSEKDMEVERGRM